MHAWSQSLVSPPLPVLRNQRLTRCRYDDHSKYDGPLLLVMEYYSESVLPSCPFRDRCSCHLTSLQEKMVVSTERVYTVEVDCASRGLKHFPKLPKHTRTVDLSGNEVG